MTAKSHNNRVRVRAIALPLEHGSWGFVLEPIVAGLLLAPTVSGAWISVFVFCLFLSRQPIRVFLVDRIAGRKLPQTFVAMKFMAAYLLLASVAFALVWNSALTYSFLPFVIVSPLAIYQIYCDTSRKSRQLIPELASAVAVSSSAAAILLAGGWSSANAFAVWGILAARFIPSIMYVRDRLRLEKGKDFSLPIVFAAHLLALFGVAFLAFNSISPTLPVFAVAILLIRAAVGLTPSRKRLRAMQIGVREVLYGGMVVLSIVIGFYFDF